MVVNTIQILMLTILCTGSKSVDTELRSNALIAGKKYPSCGSDYKRLIIFIQAMVTQKSWSCVHFYPILTIQKR